MAGFDLAGFEDFEEDLGMPRLGAMFSDEEGETFGPPKKDLYAILGVEKDADLESIKKAYKKLALKHHPDKNRGDPSAEAIFKDLSLTHKVLSDPDKRAYYEETGDTEDVDLSAEVFMKMFRETMVELMAGVSIKEMLGGMSEEEIRMMPPFPFPKELFPRDTFPPGLRCNSEGLKGIPPSVSAILKSDNPERLGEMFEAASARDLGEEDEEKEAEQRRRRNKFFGGAAFSAFGGGDMDEFDMEAELLGQLGLDDAMFGSMPPSFNPGRAKGRGGGGTHRRRAKKGGK